MALNTRQIAPRKAFGRRVTPGQESVQESAREPASQAAMTLVASEAQPEGELFSAQTALDAGKPAALETGAPAFCEIQTQNNRVLDTGEIIAKSFGVMGRNGVTFLALIAAAAAPNRLVYHLGGEALSPLITVLGCFVLYPCVFDGAIRDLKGEKPSFHDCLGAGLRGLPSAFGAIALTVMSVWLLLILPCIGLATGWAVAAPAALAEGLGLRAALARSVKLAAPHRPQIQALVVLLGALSISRAVMMMPIWGVPVEGVAVFIAGNWLFPLLLTAFAAASGAALYQELTRRQLKPAGGEQLALF
jgi:hypothetical protein